MEEVQEKVTVTPIRTFAWGPDVKRPGDEPFEVEQHQAAELRANGLVESAEGEKAAPPPRNKMARDPSNKAGGAPKKNAAGKAPGKKD